MELNTRLDLARVAKTVGLSLAQVESTVGLLDAGNTVPFITRYRKDQTGGLDEEQIRRVEQEVTKQRLLLDRKQTILRSIESQGKLTPELARQIEAADTTKWLEDLYLPFKPKKQTRATLARERGLAPLAEEILAAAPACADLDARAADFVNPDKQIATPADALLGAGHILAEKFSERADLRQRVRKIFRKTGKLISQKVDDDKKSDKPEELPALAAEVEVAEVEDAAIEGSAEAAPEEPKHEEPKRFESKKDRKKDEKKSKGFRDYFDFSEPLAKVPPHRVLAINRGEKARALRVRIDADQAAIEQEAVGLLAPAEHPHREFLQGCVRDSLARLIVPSLEREVRREMTDKAEAHAVEVFARNLRNLLLQKPVRGRRLLAIDPGFKSGCKLAALDEFGSLVANDVIHLVGSEDRRKHARTRLIEIIREHQLSVVAIGNGTACRETEELLADVIANELADQGVSYVVVNEAGASVYSASPLGREELPDYDATVRGAVSIGRRLQDPLSELVKIDPASIGVGLYQHDVKAKHLRSSLDAVVESCVNYVGVDLNTASPALLRYVSGLNALTARRLYDYRVENGPFKSRAELTSVPGFGEATFVQAAGFLKIEEGENPLDATWIHPESYGVAEKVLNRLECELADLRRPEKAGPEKVSAEKTTPAAPSAEAEQSVAASSVAEPSAAESPTAAESAASESQVAVAEQPASEAPAAPAAKSMSGPEKNVFSERLTQRLRQVEPAQLASELGVGDHLLKDILSGLSRPGRDPREDLPPPIFRKGVVKLEDLVQGMELSGTILNVVDFGAFVDIGLSDSGLVHISQLANRYIKDAHEVVSVGDVVKVWVMEVDKQRRRVSLTMIAPGSEKPPHERRPQQRSERPQQRPAQQGAARSGAAPAGAPAGGPRPARPPRSRTEGRNAQPARPKASFTPKPKPKPKPVVPITKAMEEGQEPMRTFGDLIQFFNKKKDDDEPAQPKS